MVLPPTRNTQENFSNLQAELFDLLVSSDPIESFNAPTEGNSLAIGMRKVSSSPPDMMNRSNPVSALQVNITPVQTSNFQLNQPLRALSKPELLSCSLPNSATSSPRFGPSSLLKKWRQYESQTSSPQEGSATPNFITGSTIGRAEKDLRRSRSCGDGRASSPPSVEFDAMSDKLENRGLENSQKSIIKSSSPKAEVGVQESRSQIGEGTKEEFKCGALCLFLPGFGKVKPIRAKTEAEEYHSPLPELTENNIMISRSVSLEKFECGSWASSAIITDSINNNEDGDSSANLYFDLPFELIRSSRNDANSPVTAAFIFDNKEPRGVLKASGSIRVSSRKLQESSRHVRFSVSTSPRSCPNSQSSCITPRLRKAREDFNAFLEAQSA
ncbi:hypothetical protein CRG98_001360 [Punica granatum]|uniref:Uncharacterized protein n=2 Tax=Punica granatum TaxID=22663 RepID=A0A2I0LC39_PUNGR|nr:hypothetical protein CRG98_001360 [Punica granatum]